ncbi:hypothetical protein ACVRYP_08410 [Streptococcus rifensis]
MTTDEQNKWLAEQSYWVDSQKEGVNYRPEEGKQYPYNPDNPSLGQFQVVAVEDNTDNGMQAMAVAPVVNGVVDYNNITIAYAGTNPDDKKDLYVDLNQVMLYQQDYDMNASPYEVTQGQVQTALEFANKIKTDPRFKGAHISYTGHSLGGFLACYAGVVNQSPVTAFNAPQIYASFLTKEQKEWLKQNRHLFINYRNADDHIGNFGGDPLGISRYITTTAPQKGFFKDLVSHHHGLSTWKFDEKTGLVVDEDGNTVRGQARFYQDFTLSQLRQIKLRYDDYRRAGALSGVAKIYLDSIQALNVAEGFDLAAQVGSDEISRYCDQATQAVEEKWRTIDWYGFQELSSVEVQSIFAAEGVTYDRIVGNTNRYFDKRRTKAKAISDKFATLSSDINELVQKKIEQDNELAMEFQRWSV